jgi:hypothetical protein
MPPTSGPMAGGMPGRCGRRGGTVRCGVRTVVGGSAGRWARSARCGEPRTGLSGPGGAGGGPSRRPGRWAPRRRPACRSGWLGWLLVAGCWLLVAGCWLLVAGCWSAGSGRLGSSVSPVCPPWSLRPRGSQAAVLAGRAALQGLVPCGLRNTAWRGVRSAPGPGGHTAAECRVSSDSSEGAAPGAGPPGTPPKPVPAPGRPPCRAALGRRP